MRYHLNQDLEEKKGVVSNLHSFLNRHLDTGFKTKWSGLWSPPYKFLDYFSIRVNGIWLGPETVEAVDYGEEMVFYHETDSFSIREKIEAPPASTGIEIEIEVENNLEKVNAVHLTLELGVDIRHKSEDIAEESYKVKENADRVSFSRNGKKLIFTADNDFTISGEAYMKEHFPDERQKCLVPGDISFREEVENTKSFQMQFSTSESSFGGIKDIEQDLRSDGIGRIFECGIESLKNMAYENEGIGIIAGHPWFQSYWARDSFWSVLGLIDAGYFELSEDILTNFAEKNLPGKINLDGSEEDFQRSDTAPLFVIAAEKLDRHFRTNEKIDEARQKAIEILDIEGKIVDHEPEGTWMDTLERDRAVDIQSLWLEAAEVTGETELSEKLSEGLQKFSGETFMKDNLAENFRSINPAVPMMFGQIDPGKAEKYLETLNSEFSSRYGARTRSVIDAGYEADGYHTGSSWGLTTAWAAAANFRYGNLKQGRNFLEKMNKFLDRNQPGALPEVVGSETGELLGCSEQAWSAGMMVHVIDTYLLGIKVRDDKVIVDPAGEIDMERTGKKIGDEELDLKFHEGEVEIINDPEISVEVRNS